MGCGKDCQGYVCRDLMFNILFILLLVLAVVESITTAYGLLSGKASEVNPFLRWMVRKMGTHTMLEGKLVGTFILFVGIWLSRSILVVSMTGIPILIICIWNMRELSKIK